MSSLFPRRPSVSLGERDHRLVDLDEDTADEVFEALAASTTRQIFLELHDSPGTASDLADATDTSVQNVQYHLEKLGAADLVEVVDIWYSERGTEMKVYAPADESLVLVAGGDESGSLRQVLATFVGGLALLLPMSALVGLLARRLAAMDAPGLGDDAVDVPEVEEEVMIESTSATANGAPETIAGLDPGLFAGLVFFLGGAFVLLLAIGVWRRRRLS